MKHLRIFWLLIFIFTFIFSETLLARAGRGGSFSGSSSSGYSGSSSSGSYRYNYNSSSSSSSSSSGSGYTTSRSELPDHDYLTDNDIESLKYKFKVTETGKVDVTIFYVVDIEKETRGLKIMYDTNPEIQFTKRFEIFDRDHISSNQGKAGCYYNCEWLYITFPEKKKGRVSFSITARDNTAMLLYGKTAVLHFKSQRLNKSGIKLPEQVPVELEIPSDHPDIKPQLYLKNFESFNGDYFREDFQMINTGKTKGNVLFTGVIEKPLNQQNTLQLEVFFPEGYFNEIKAPEQARGDSYFSSENNAFYADLNYLVKLNSSSATVETNISFKNKPPGLMFVEIPAMLAKAADSALKKELPEHNDIYHLEEYADLSLMSSLKADTQDHYVSGSELSFRYNPAGKNDTLKYTHTISAYQRDSNEIVDIALARPEDGILRSDNVTLEVLLPERLAESDLKKTDIFMISADYGSTELIKKIKYNKSATKKGDRVAVAYELEHGLLETQMLMLRLYFQPGKAPTAGFFTRSLAAWPHNFIFFADGPYLIWLWPVGVLFILWLIWFIAGRKKRKSLKKEKEAQKEQAQIQEFINSIKAKDPGFNYDSFLKRVQKTAEKVQLAWGQNNMNLARLYVSQGIYNRFRTQLELMRTQENLINPMSDIKVMQVTPFHYETSGEYQTLHIEIKIKAKDAFMKADSSESQIQEKLAATKSSTFSEIYSFTRKQSAKTQQGRNVADGFCPNCGAGIDENAPVNKCPNCGSLYNSGEYDWVLSEITQTSVFTQPEDGKSNPQLEDRASALFWRWFAANSTGNKGLIRRESDDTFLAGFNPNGTIYTEPAVGAADTVSFNPGAGTAEVLIKWSGKHSSANNPTYKENILTLRRTTSIAGANFADHGCHNCGAPLPETDAQRCSYCDAEVPAKTDDWLLAGVKTT